MKDWDPPLLNQRTSNRLLTVEYFRFEAEKALKNHRHLESLMRVTALRKSCGVETEKTSTVNVRLPPRYCK
jgi:hypothetical protein